MLQQGQADVATAAELLVSLNCFTKADLSIVATLSSSHQIRVVARRSAGVAQPRDLKGKRVGTVAGTSAEYYLDTWLLFQGVDRSEVTLVPLPADRLAAAMQSHEVDAVAIWEPIASAVSDALKDDLAAMPTPRVYTQHFALVTGRRRTAGVEAETVKLLRALARASQLIAREPATARQILSTRLHITDAQAAAYLAAHDYSLNLDQSLVSTMESQARWALRSGQVTKGDNSVNLLRAIDPALLRGAVPGAVTLVQ
jgi:NitT/TauT family transport system substrate-binding protein